MGGIGGQEAHAQTVLQKAIDAVQRAAGQAAGDDEDRRGYPQAGLLLPETLRRPGVSAEPPRGLVPDRDQPYGRGVGRRRRQAGAARLPEELPELLRSVALGGRRLVRDRKAPAAQVAQPQSSVGGRGGLRMPAGPDAIACVPFPACGETPDRDQQPSTDGQQ